MNENNIPVTCDGSVITSVSQSSQTNDIIDLTEISDSDVCEITSNHSVIVSNNSVHPQQPVCKPARNWRRKNTNSSEDNPSTKGSVDDSICILYENIQPPPEIVVVNEIIIDNSEQNESANNDSLSIPIPPLIMGSITEDIAPIAYPDPVFPQISPHFAEISSERTSSSYQPIDYSLDVQVRAPRPLTVAVLPSCKYATATESPSLPLSTVDPGLQRRPLSRMPAVLNLKTAPSNSLSNGSGLEKSDIVTKVPKIQCGICLDGPDELAASERNFISTNCGHVFCNTCIKTSMKNAAKCPKCRKKITARSIHNLYL